MSVVSTDIILPRQSEFVSLEAAQTLRIPMSSYDVANKKYIDDNSSTQAAFSTSSATLTDDSTDPAFAGTMSLGFDKIGGMVIMSIAPVSWTAASTSKVTGAVGTIPEGYRPSSRIERPFLSTKVVDPGVDVRSIVPMRIDPDGSILFNFDPVADEVYVYGTTGDTKWIV